MYEDLVLYDRLPRVRARREHENLLAMVLLEISMRMTGEEALRSAPGHRL